MLFEQQNLPILKKISEKTRNFKSWQVAILATKIERKLDATVGRDFPFATALGPEMYVEPFELDAGAAYERLSRSSAGPLFREQP